MLSRQLTLGYIASGIASADLLDGFGGQLCEIAGLATKAPRSTATPSDFIGDIVGMCPIEQVSRVAAGWVVTDMPNNVWPIAVGQLKSVAMCPVKLAIDPNLSIALKTATLPFPATGLGYGHALPKPGIAALAWHFDGLSSARRRIGFRRGHPSFLVDRRAKKYARGIHRAPTE